MASTERTSGLTLRDEQRNFTRARLIECAAQVFQEKGLASTTISDITSRANASRATFYLHFKDKDDLLAAIRSEAGYDIELYYRRLDDVLASDDPAQFAAWVADALTWFDDHHAMLMALEYAALADHDPANDTMSPPTRFTSYMPQYLSRWADDRHDEAEMRVWLIVQQIKQVHLTGPRSAFWHIEREELLGILTSTVWAILMPHGMGAARRTD